MKIRFILLGLLAVLLTACGSKGVNTETEVVKPALMWFDAEANFARFSNPDSIDYYLDKIHSLGFTHALSLIHI